MSEHLIDGEFQSDKYPTTPRGKVPLSCKDPTAQPHLLLYALGRHKVDAGFACDLAESLRLQGYLDTPLGAINQIILWRIDELFKLSPDLGSEAGIELDALTAACLAIERVVAPMPDALATQQAAHPPQSSAVAASALRIATIRAALEQCSREGFYLLDLPGDKGLDKCAEIIAAALDASQPTPEASALRALAQQMRMDANDQDRLAEASPYNRITQKATAAVLRKCAAALDALAGGAEGGS